MRTMPISVAMRLMSIILISVLAGLVLPGFSQTYTGEPSERVTINLGETAWKFSRTDPFPAAKESNYPADQSWTEVAIPHCFSAKDSWLNIGEGLSPNLVATVWYRKHFTVDAAFKGKRIEIEFQGVNIGCAVYINGVLKSHIHKVQQPGEVTHVFGHLPFVLDITNDVKFGENNVIAVRVSNNAGGSKFFTNPGFGTSPSFGMALGGIHRPVFLHITDNVHVPLNVYSNIRRWGTYVATAAATDASATVRLQTNVYNDNTQEKSVTVTTKIIDAQKQIVWEQTTPAQTISANANRVFDQTATIANPKLWYPNNNPNGKPYMHRVYHIVKVDGKTTDVFQSPLGIRVITWDKDFAYFNGKPDPHVFWGFGCRYDYPGFGSAVPVEQQWRDIKLMAECGGSMLRPGHVPIANATMEACDAYGVCLFDPTGDNERALDVEPNITYKDECHRDCMIRDRNNPSVAIWELNNGCFGGKQGDIWRIQPGWIKRMIDSTRVYDPIATRAASSRDSTDYWPTQPGVLIIGDGFSFIRKTTLLPGWAAESWVQANTRYSYDYEAAHADRYIQDLTNTVKDKGCAYTHWMFQECGGEMYKAYLDASIVEAQRKSLGCSVTDQNRIPKLLFQVYKKAWYVPYQIQPGVALQSHWNFPAGSRTVIAYSNCPKVELFVNGQSKGVQTPGGTTKKFQWTNVAWAAGTLKAEGKDASGKTVCTDEKKTAGTPKKIVLSLESPIIRPDNGETFVIRANGTDAGFILATIVDADGNWCPLASNNITFSVSGEGTYIGSANHVGTIGKPIGYHGPGDPELMAEGGMMKIAVQSTFKAGSVTVNASADGGLANAAPLTFTTYPPDYRVMTKPTAPVSLMPSGIVSKTFKVAGVSFPVPAEFSGKPVSIKLYNLSGKLLRETVIKGKRVSLHRYGITGSGMFIVRCSEIASPR